MQFGYEKLRVTDSIHLLITRLYAMTKAFPKDEMFSLTSQIRRASVSVLLNLAEGNARQGRKEYIHFIKISIGSVIELDAAIKIACNLDYISMLTREEMRSLICSVYFQLLKLRDSLRQL